MSNLPQESFHITDGSSSAKKRDFSIEFKLNCINKAKFIFHRGVLIEMAHYYAILAEKGVLFGRAY